MPAVQRYLARFVPGASDDGIVRFLLTAGAIGVLYKQNASISGAEVGCQREVGSACSMAAGALSEAPGGRRSRRRTRPRSRWSTTWGLACDPVGGLVQRSASRRNADGRPSRPSTPPAWPCAGDGQHFVSLDKVIETMRDTGADMAVKFKATSRGGLAVNVLEAPIDAGRRRPGVLSLGRQRKPQTRAHRTTQGLAAP